jgi:hypothetical protein
MKKSTMAHWHTLCLAVYLSITVSDFLLFPLFTEFQNNALNPDKIVELATKFEGGASQVAIVQALDKTRVWQPLTLQQNGMFHMAFGLILGIGAWKRTNKDVDGWPVGAEQPIPPKGPQVQ